MASPLTFEEWKEQNPISFPAEFETTCKNMGIDIDQEIDNILREYYLVYLDEQEME